MMRRMPRDDGGAALVLVLVLVTVVAAGLAVVLSLADTSIRTTVQLREQAANTYAADGAVQTAINTVRNSTYNGAVGQHCLGSPDDTMTVANPSGAGSATVSCRADPMRVLVHCPSGTQCNRPSNAILTTGLDASEGINIEPASSTFRVHGVVFSHSTINVASGTLLSDTPVYARGTCPGKGKIVSSPAAQCGYTDPYPLGDDPQYGHGAATVPVYRPLPKCGNGDSVVTFEPGYYDDAVTLSDMMNGKTVAGRKCGDNTWWFKPGIYYFDFHNAAGNRNPALPSGDNEWTVRRGTLVAGTPTSPTGTELNAPPLDPPIPGSCASPITGGVGVTFIFGGDSRLVVNQPGEAEICGSYDTDHPPVAIHGLTAGSAVTTKHVGAQALTPTAVPTPGGFTGATTANLASVGAGFASWQRSGGQPGSTVALTGFVPPSPIPRGSILKAARVIVTHRHDDVAKDATMTVVVTPTGGTPVTATVAGIKGGPSFQPQEIPIDGVGGPTLAEQVHAGGFTGAGIAVTAGIATNDTEYIDAVQLELEYVAPAFRKADGCILVRYTDKGSCALIRTPNNVGTLFYVQGTTYAPLGVIDLSLNNAAQPIFRFGVIVRSLWVKVTGSFQYAGPVIEVPDDGPGFAFSVHLAAYLCAGAGPCPTSGPPALRARVSFIDGPIGPVAGKRQVSVLSWSSGT